MLKCYYNFMCVCILSHTDNHTHMHTLRRLCSRASQCSRQGFDIFASSLV